MKRIYLSILILISLSAGAQTLPSYFSPIASPYDYQWLRTRYLRLPLSATGLEAGAVRYNAADSSIYVYTGFSWQKAGGSASIDSFLYATRRYVDSSTAVFGSRLYDTYNTHDTLTQSRNIDLNDIYGITFTVDGTNDLATGINASGFTSKRSKHDFTANNGWIYGQLHDPAQVYKSRFQVIGLVNDSTHSAQLISTNNNTYNKKAALVSAGWSDGVKLQTNVNWKTSDSASGYKGIYVYSTAGDGTGQVKIDREMLSTGASTDSALVRKSDGTIGLYPVGSGGGTSTLAGATDAAISSPTSGQVLAYNGEKWANTNTIGYDFTSPTAGQLLRLKTATTVEAFTPNYATQTALQDSIAVLRDSLAALRADIGTGGGVATNFDSIRVLSSTPSTGNVWVDSITGRLKVRDRVNNKIFTVHYADSTMFTDYDADAQAYFDAEGITSQTEKDAVQAFVIATKGGANAWSRIKGLYFGLGTGMKNAKSPGTFDLTTATGSTMPTVGASGYVFDGVDDYLNTNITPSSHLADNDEGFAVYVKTSTDGKCVMGAIGGYNSYLYPKDASNNFAYTHHSGSDHTVAGNATVAGTYVTTIRNASGSYYRRAIKNGAALHSLSGAVGSTFAPNQPVYIGANNLSGSADVFNAATLGMAAVTLGLTDTQAAELDTAISNFITALSRN